MWLSFFSLCHGVMWLFSWRTPNLNIPKIVVFRTYHITHESVQSDDFCVEVSGCCRLHTRQSMPYSAQVSGAASLAGSRLGGTSCHGPWWWESKCLSSWIWRWDQQQMRRDLYMIHMIENSIRSAKWRLWQFYAIFGKEIASNDWLNRLAVTTRRRVLVALPPTYFVGRSLLLALWRWLLCCSVWWVLPRHVWLCRKPLGGWWSSQGRPE